MRIGPKMQEAADILQAMGGHSRLIYPIVRRVGPHGSTRYGYQIARRVIRAGLIRATWVSGRCELDLVAIGDFRANK